MQVITITNLKGGSGKTTTAAYLAHAYAAQGKSVLIVDADPQESSYDWCTDAEWEIPTITLPVKNLHTRLDGIVSPDTDIVIIDTPPINEKYASSDDPRPGIVLSALRAADTVIVALAPTMMEFARLQKVWAIVDKAAALGATSTLAVLLNRTTYNANSTPLFRQLITDGGHTVLRTTIPRQEKYAQSYGAPIVDLGKYAAVATEIEKLGESA